MAYYHSGQRAPHLLSRSSISPFSPQHTITSGKRNIVVHLIGLNFSFHPPGLRQTCPFCLLRTLAHIHSKLTPEQQQYQQWKKKIDAGREMQNRWEKGGTVRGLHTEGDGNSGPKRGLNAAAHPIIPPTDEAHHIQPSFSSIFPTLSLPLSLALFFSLAFSLSLSLLRARIISLGAYTDAYTRAALWFWIWLVAITKMVQRE